MDDFASGGDGATNQPVVIDNGSGIIKAGFAGEDIPKCIFPTYVGRPKHTRVMAGLEGNTFVGKKVSELRGLMKLNWPAEHGIVEDWSDMEKIWTHVYQNELHAASQEHPVLLTDAPLNPRQNREKAAEVFFENFNVPALYITPQAVLSLYASGRVTGVVLDSGDGTTTAVPIYEGFVLPHSITRIDVAGRDITSHLQLLLRRAGVRFHTTSEREVVREMKEKVCYVSTNPEKEEMNSGDGRNVKGIDYRLPDGNLVRLESERYRAPEILFKPELVGFEYDGVHQCLVNAINKSDLDLRESLYKEIVLAGGSTLFPGFGDRLLSEIRQLAPKDIRTKISAPRERKYSTWIGGSIMASLSTFKKMWVSAEEYGEEGVSILHRKFFG